LSLLEEAQRVMAELQPQLESEVETAEEVVAVDPAPISTTEEVEEVGSVETETTSPTEIDPIGDVAGRVAANLNLELVDVLAERIREQDVEIAALRRLTAEAVIAAREAVSLSGFASFEEIEEEAPRRWWKLWRR
jgi:hypothetical protein